MRFLEERAFIDTKKIWSIVFEMRVDINQKLIGDIYFKLFRNFERVE